MLVCILKMQLSNALLCSFTLLVIFIGYAMSVYTHAAFVNEIRRSRQKYAKAKSLSLYDPSEEYSLQMNNTALLGVQPCSYMQCRKIAVIGAGNLVIKSNLVFCIDIRRYQRIDYCV